MAWSEESGRADLELVRYLLELLPYEDSERLDQASIEDDEVAARLRVVENDLIDAYVRGTLDRGTRERFESHYLASPLHRKRVRFAVNFLRAVDRAAARAAAETDDDRAAGPAPHRLPAARSNVASVLAAVAALVLIAVGTLLFASLRSAGVSPLAQRANATPGRDALKAEAGDDTASAASVQETVPARDVAAVRPSRAAAPRPNRGLSAEAPLAALLLLPQTRGIGAIPTVSVPAGSDRVAFELRLEANDAPRYRVDLRNPATNQIVWRAGSIAPTSSGEEPSVFVHVPARLLRPQPYSLDVTDRGAVGADEIVGSYTFRVLPR